MFANAILVNFSSLIKRLTNFLRRCRHYLTSRFSYHVPWTAAKLKIAINNSECFPTMALKHVKMFVGKIQISFPVILCYVVLPRPYVIADILHDRGM